MKLKGSRKQNACNKCQPHKMVKHIQISHWQTEKKSINTSIYH